MEVKGIETREIAGSPERVLVLQPTDDGNSGGHFEGRAKGRKLWGQEVWVHNLGAEALELLEYGAESAFDRGYITETAPGKFVIIKGEVHLATQRDEQAQPTCELRSGLVTEYGPTQPTAQPGISD